MYGMRKNSRSNMCERKHIIKLKNTFNFMRKRDIVNNTFWYLTALLCKIYVFQIYVLRFFEKKMSKDIYFPVQS